MSGVDNVNPDFFSRITLVICDEGHLLDGQAPGVGLELLLSRMRAREDNDTIAAIVGAAVGALHGKGSIPERWVQMRVKEITRAMWWDSRPTMMEELEKAGILEEILTTVSEKTLDEMAEMIGRGIHLESAREIVMENLRIPFEDEEPENDHLPYL